MTPTAIHPFADEWTDDYAVFVASSERVAVSAPFRHFLMDCVADGRRPVLMSSATASVTAHAALAMQAAGAVWAAHADGGVFDARSGYRIGAFADLWLDGSTDRERLHGFQSPPDDATGAIVFDVHATSRASEETMIGPLADHMVDGFGGGALERWGEDEPLAEPWRHDAATRWVRGQMPVTDVLRAAGPGGSFCTINVARTPIGLIEHVRGAVPVGSGALDSSSPAALAAHPAMTATLTTLVERFRPTVAMISHADFDRLGVGLGQSVRPRRTDQPLAMLIGPRAVRDLRVDVDALASVHDVTAVGSARMPSLLVRLSRPELLWVQLRAFVHDVGVESIASVLGLEVERTR